MFIATMAKAAPKVAPWETPNVDAEARGLCRIACKIHPDRPKPAPAMIAVQIRGIRLFWTTRLIFLSADFPKMPLMSSVTGVL